MEREDCITALSGQIFMGMVSSQYQARLDTVRLIDALVTACIRFVYFSMEDELRSKVSRHVWSYYPYNAVIVVSKSSHLCSKWIILLQQGLAQQTALTYFH